MNKPRVPKLGTRGRWVFPGASKEFQGISRGVYRLPEGSRGWEGVSKGWEGFSGRFQGLPEGSREFQVIPGVERGFQGVWGVPGDSRRWEGISRGCDRGFPGSERGFQGLSGCLGGYWGDRGFQGVTRGDRVWNAIHRAFSPFQSTIFGGESRKWCVYVCFFSPLTLICGFEVHGYCFNIQLQVVWSVY